ncbi:hypothetical protein HMPREF0851_01228 [Streptococcus sp. M334]|nr:hypothetical protein HMPREF0851_01228 [Streptococcus sp. M334]
MAGEKLNRVSMSTAARVGLLTKISGWILRIAVNVADAHDKIPNNDRLNF